VPPQGGGGGEGTGGEGEGGSGKKKAKKKKKKQKGKKGGQDNAPASAAEPAGDPCSSAGPHGQEAAQVVEEEGVEDEGLDDCSICLSLLAEPGGSGVEALLCNHSFHGDCLDLWVTKCHAKQTLATCPYCRGPLVRSM
jgi:hypothetical protein